MRVTHVISGLDQGGAEGMLGRLAAAQRDLGVEARVISLTSAGPAAEPLRAAGIPVEAMGMTRGLPWPAGLARLYAALRAWQPDLVQTWMYHADLAGGLAARAAGLPVLWGLRRTASEGSVKPLTRLVRRTCALLSGTVPARIVACSETAARSHVALGYDARRIVVVPNGVDAARFRPDPAARAAVRREAGVPEGAPLVGLLARVHPDKDHAAFLAVARLVRDQRPDAVFLLCGAGTDRPDGPVGSLLHATGLRPVFRLLGPRTDPERVLAALDVHLLTSRTEAFPNAVAEAMACGVPCVSTDAGDAREIVGEAGLVPGARTPEALAGAVLRLLDLEPPERRALGDAARARVLERYDLATVARRFLDVQRGAAGLDRRTGAGP
jgi:glycosyltransferase involved in cell wall biosynthesis